MAPLLPPDHKPLASPLDDLNVAEVAVTAVVGMLAVATAHGLCPVIDSAEDPPYEDHAPVSYRVKPLGTVGSTSANPVFGNSFDAADDAIRARYARRNTQTRVAQMFSTTSHALLSSSEG